MNFDPDTVTELLNLRVKRPERENKVIFIISKNGQLKKQNCGEERL